MATQDSDGTEIIGLEANVDGFTDTNADGVNDQYQTGGPVRAVKRDWYADGSLYFAGTNIKIGKVIGWFYLPTDKKGEPVGVKNVNGDIYSDLITSSRPEIFGNWGIRDLSTVKYIVIHGTMGLSVQNAVDTWTVGGRDASANYIVHENQIVGCVGENYTAWHCGGQGAITNQNSIGIEHVNATLNGASSTFSSQTIESGAKLVAEICKRFGIVPSRKTIVGHKEVSATACPQSLNLDAYVEKVKQYYSGKTAATQKEETEQGEEDMITISAPKRGIALMMGGKFLPILDPKTPIVLWNQGVKHYQLDTKTFDAWQGMADKTTLDGATVEKLIQSLNLDAYVEKVKQYYSGKTAATQKEETEQGEEDMITISAPKRGIALMMGGKFLPILDSKTPTVFWNQGVKHYQLDTITFDAWQGKADKSTLDDATVDKLIKGLKK